MSIIKTKATLISFPIELLKAAVCALLEDDSFTRLQSVTARSAHKVATEVLEWCGRAENASSFDAFAADILTEFETVVNSTGTLKKLKTETIWKSFHNLRVSVSYETKWTTFLKASTSVIPASPIFFQYVSDCAFKRFLKSKLTSVISKSTTPGPSIDALSYNEENALRYTAGYVLKAIRKKIKRSSHPLKEDVMLCVSELADDVGDASEHESSDWTHLLDRSGGLQYVNDMTYRLMGAVEICVRNVFTTKGLHQTVDLKDKLVLDIITDENVLFFWSMLAVNWCDDEADLLLTMIAEEWVTRRVGHT